MHNSVEAYLRTGKYIDVQLTPSNSTARQKGIIKDMDSNIDSMCVLAVQGAAETFANMCVHGTMGYCEMTGLDTFLVSPNETSECCVCARQMHVMAAAVFPVGGSACLVCRRRRCFQCTDVVQACDDDEWNPCRYCDPESVPADEIESF